MQPLVERASQHGLYLFPEPFGMFRAGVLFECIPRLPHFHDREVIQTSILQQKLEAHRSRVLFAVCGKLPQQSCSLRHHRRRPTDIDMRHHKDPLVGILRRGLLRDATAQKDQAHCRQHAARGIHDQSIIQTPGAIVFPMAVVVIAGRKGGIGKSTITGNLAAEFAASGQTVVALDADPQHSLAAWAGQGDGFLSQCVDKLTRGSADELRAKVRTAEKTADVVLIDTPPGLPDVAWQAMLLADLVLLPCGPSPLDLFPMKDALALALKARAERRSKKPRIRLVPSKVLRNTNLGRELSSSLEQMGKKVLPGIGQRIVVAEAVMSGLTVREYAPGSPAHAEFEQLAKAVEKVVRR